MALGTYTCLMGCYHAKITSLCSGMLSDKQELLKVLEQNSSNGSNGSNIVKHYKEKWDLTVFKWLLFVLCFTHLWMCFIELTVVIVSYLALSFLLRTSQTFSAVTSASYESLQNKDRRWFMNRPEDSWNIKCILLHKNLIKWIKENT